MWEGKVNKIFFQNESVTIGALATDKGQINFKGDIYGLNEGDMIKITEGEIKVHEKYGEQIPYRKKIPPASGG